MASDYISDSLRKVVSARAQNRCEYCKCSANFTTETFSIEHILPRSLGGGNTLGNLAWSCMGCNIYKGAKIQGLDSVISEMVAIFNPRQQEWHQHFTWSQDFCEMSGRTAIGRVSIVVLKLNRHGVVNLRHVLTQVGKHPPG